MDLEYLFLIFLPRVPLMRAFVHLLSVVLQDLQVKVALSSPACVGDPHSRDSSFAEQTLEEDPKMEPSQTLGRLDSGPV